MATPNQVVNEGYPFGIFTFTYVLSDALADDAAAAATSGKAVTLDTTGPGKVKLAGNGDKIFGRVYVAERRVQLGFNVASVARKFKERLPAANGHGIVVGNRIVGAGAGLVKLETTADVTNPIVIETGADYVIAEYL